jgi:NAD(P)-dependent dehydrogenase (short-subunit alcohol dehydrogenase family)
MSTPQAPLHTGFGATTTAAEVIRGVRLDGKIAIVTGGYVGVGLETTRALASAGAKVIVPARSVEKARGALAGIADVELEQLDLADPSSVDAFAQRFRASERPVHLLFNNAGIMAVPQAKAVDGFELQLATNHLGHFRLTARLWPALRQARGAKVIALTSLGHMFSSVDLADPNFERTPYDKWIAYARSKSANALFALTLDARGQKHGVRAFSVHPGSVATELARSVPEEELLALRARMGASSSPRKTPIQGAATSIWSAVSPRLEGLGGVYCEDVDIAEAVPADFKGLRGARPWIQDRSLGDELWSRTEEWTGVRFEV